MLQGLYSAAIAMDGAGRQHEIIAKNLAHVQMPGYRRFQVLHGTFASSDQESAQELADRSGTGTRGLDFMVDHTQGHFQKTGRELDVSIHGEGFFVVQEDGKQLLTRNGSFMWNNTGTLITRDGRTVQGLGGPIRIENPQQAPQVAIDSAGRVIANGIEIGQLRIVDLEDKNQLTNFGTTLFEDSESQAQPTQDVTIVQGELEQSNVHPVQELVDMIAVQRRYDAAAKTLRTLMRSLEQRINLQGGN